MEILVQSTFEIEERSIFESQTHPSPRLEIQVYQDKNIPLNEEFESL